MLKAQTRNVRRGLPARLWLLSMVVGAVGLLAACSAGSQTPSAQSSGVPTATPVALKALQVEPATGPVRETITITADGLPEGKTVRLEWGTHSGAFVTEAAPGAVKFLDRKMTESRTILGEATVDAQGWARLSIPAPEDFGGAHDIYAVADGQDVALGTFRIVGSATLSPTSGPVGTPIIITVRGMGRDLVDNPVSLLYDDKFAGAATAITTKGSAVIPVRAAGPVGAHTLQLTAGGDGATASLSPTSAVRDTVLDASWTFTVTHDAGAPPFSVNWPAGSRVATLGSAIPKIMMHGAPAAQGSVTGLEPPYGDILSQASLWAKGLPPSSEVEVVWVTAKGGPSGASKVTEIPLTKATTGADGALRVAIQVPDSPGGWHVVKAVHEGKVLLEAPYFLRRSLGDTLPKQVKAGQTFTVHLKGIGWTDVDNSVAYSYDNAHIGNARAAEGSGDVTITLTASGAPGTHLIDVYPSLPAGMDGKMDSRLYETPLLTALQEHPGHALGYEIPIFRLAIEVVP